MSLLCSILDFGDGRTWVQNFRFREKINASLKVELVVRAMSFDEIVCDPFDGTQGSSQPLQGESTLHNPFLGVTFTAFPTSFWNLKYKTLIFSFKYQERDSHM
jgi:hypothetical protein